MLKRIPFGAYLPDQPPGAQLTVADNVYPYASEYRPVGGFDVLTPALAGITGGAAFLSLSGTTSFLSGTALALYRYSGASWSKLIDATGGRWRFAQFGNNAIAVNGGAPVSYDLAGGTAAALAGNPPAASLVATVRDYVVLAGQPDAQQTVTWSGRNRSDIWPGTAPAPADSFGSDAQLLPDGGRVMGLVGGEYGIVWQKNAVKRMDFQGGDVVFAFNEIAGNIGCMAEGSIAASGRLSWALSEQGFVECDGAGVKPIGDEQVDATFFARFSRRDIVQGIYAAVDPRRPIVMWAMPGKPGMILLFNYQARRWATITTDVRLVFSGFTANVPLDAIGNVDVGIGSLDSPRYAGGNPLLLVARTDGTIGTLTGDPMEATLTTARLDLNGGRARIRTIKPDTDASDVMVTVEGRRRGSSVPVSRASSDLRPSGFVPLRANAAQFVVETRLRGAWAYAAGFGVEYENGGVR